MEKFNLFNGRETRNADYQSTKPRFYRLSNIEDQKQLQILLTEIRGVTIHDTIISQITELLRCRNPSYKGGSKELKEALDHYISGVSLDEYGTWVFYPWSNHLVHILDENEFVEVRSNRNKYKITQKEHDLLATKKVGVVGLSVGQSVAIALAMERSFGEIRIADFDTLDLTNLNRIRSGLVNLGLSKCIMVAREIAEIDPFLKVTLYPEGLTEGNIEDFLLKGGKLDALIEECDGLYIKVQSRVLARKHCIPVIMDSSDRGMVDIERFDKEPNRPLFHGSIEHLDIDKLKLAKTNEEKVPFVMSIVGVDTMSKRVKASMPEVEQSITTWPQLATSVLMGGAFAADVYRRLMLGSDFDSGRYFVDIEEIIKPVTAEKIDNSLTEYVKSFGSPLSKEDLLKYKQQTILEVPNQDQTKPDSNTISKMVRSASLAPSGGNAQPWKWLYSLSGFLYLFHDHYYSTSLLDFEDTGSNIAFGAAIENIILEASLLNLSVHYTLFPQGHKLLVATIWFSKSHTQNFAGSDNDLARFIPLRHTNRLITQRQTIEENKLRALERIAQTPNGISLKILDSKEELEEMAEIVAAADRIRMLNPYGHYDMFQREMRWTPEENQKTKDGIDIDTLDLTLSERAGIQVAKDWDALRFLADWRLGKAFEKITRKGILGSSALCILRMEGTQPSDYVEAGIALQKIWLLATKFGIAFQPQAPIIFLFSRLIEGKGYLLNEYEKSELAILKKRFDALANTPSHLKEAFMFRLYVADEAKVKSLRRELVDVLYWED